jgi:IS4 transposase
MNAWMWAREFKDGDAPRGGLLESRRWIESYDIIAEQARQLPGTRHVFVGDRESDMLALMVRAHELDHAADYLVRCQHNRALPQGGKLWERVMKSEPVGAVAFEMPAGRGRKARRVQQDIRMQRVSMDDGKRGQIEVTCLIASETDPPVGSKPVVWRLLTNRVASTLEQACELIDWYRARWEIELFFLVLKEGCRVERLQLGNIQRLQTALALYMVIAWRINRLMRLGRTLPDLPADLLFEDDEWRAAFILNKKAVPKTVPPLNTVIRLIAQLGGFLGRKGDGEPGAKTIWLGMRDIAVFVQGARFARESGMLG